MCHVAGSNVAHNAFPIPVHSVIMLQLYRLLIPMISTLTSNAMDDKYMYYQNTVHHMHYVPPQCSLPTALVLYVCPRQSLGQTLTTCLPPGPLGRPQPSRNHCQPSPIQNSPAPALVEPVVHPVLAHRSDSAAKRDEHGLLYGTLWTRSVFFLGRLYQSCHRRIPTQRQRRRAPAATYRPCL